MEETIYIKINGYITEDKNYQDKAGKVLEAYLLYDKIYTADDHIKIDIDDFEIVDPIFLYDEIESLKMEINDLKKLMNGK